MHVEDGSKDINIGEVTNELVNSLEMSNIILHVEVIWDTGGSHSG